MMSHGSDGGVITRRDLAAIWINLGPDVGLGPAKSCTVTVKGRLQRPPIIRMSGDSIWTVSVATVLGLVLDEHLSFAQHTQSIEERFDKRPARILLTKAYRIVSTAALPVLAGVLPAHIEVIAAGRTDRERDGRTAAEVRAFRWYVRSEMIAEWQKNWDDEKNDRELYRYFSEVSARFSSDWVEPDYQTTQLLTGHYCFRKRLHELGLNDTSMCLCEQKDEDMDRRTSEVPTKALLASYMVAYRVAKCKKPHMIAEELILSEAVDMTKRLNNTISRHIHDIAEDINEQIVGNLSVGKTVGVCTDGTRAMSGQYGGLQALIKSKVPSAKWSHCVIQREALEAKNITPELSVMMDSIIKPVNYIKI
ncbi:Retrovirus-related Pol polyprotein from type-1 retrotransposable element R1 4 [Eumeta japonica]|uniref:Retrovirus-related Pol polyprotein from type-1 retrotransposable element R1 4 n=1 Tax=Eumeta variegata TaxID=151549 RepID=A0A4C1TUW3_EUMVA|nr:Retrovirus-related Pol polyprotein from type-1 retrotransposable element R1 4 [Eumeta japonica]